ncbi:hypothetical protein QAD02_014579 [Eretmocerus hayati]|uniref:Uncharacterized protein n=1 Tax=Eretmocerus hayati TaxID=131215 RepID=A0ACC2P8L7_9HYME|nr:hypothetical protein QAD02_014579 [Eretmocerus hayati]
MLFNATVSCQRDPAIPAPIATYILGKYCHSIPNALHMCLYPWRNIDGRYRRREKMARSDDVWEGGPLDRSGIRPSLSTNAIGRGLLLLLQNLIDFTDSSMCPLPYMVLEEKSLFTFSNTYDGLSRYSGSQPLTLIELPASIRLPVYEDPKLKVSMYLIGP